MPALIAGFFSLFLLGSLSGIVLGQEENWVEVVRFTGTGAFFGSTIPSTDPFTINQFDWRIKWEYEINIPDLTAFLFDVKLADTGEIIDSYSNSGNLNITQGIMNITDYQGELYLFIGTNAKSYSILVEQNTDSIPEFSSWAILPIGLVSTLVVIVIGSKFRKNKEVEKKRTNVQHD